ncbi:PAS domain-containing protein [Bosea sp. Root381]|uniref:PAS domain-containing protein n=1 Tax=Bosea sp. Root381 TaxID=1736524 RepID=UPI0009EAB269|nr:PAS domain-containing protein [Bosea sp. Root381]
MSVETEHDRIDAEIIKVQKSTDPFAAAVRATRMPMLITDPNLPDNPIVFANDAFLRLTGYSREEVVGHNCRFLQGPKTDPADVNRLRDSIARRAQIEMELINHRKDGTPFHNRVLISPVYDENGHLSYFFASQFDVTLERDRLVRLQKEHDKLEKEVERRTRELRQSEEQLRFTMRAARLGSWTLDLVDMRLACSDICKQNFGRSPGEPFTYEDLVASIVPTEREGVQISVKEAVEGHTDYEHEYRIVTPSGESRWIMARGCPHYGADDRPISMSGVTLDMTENRRNEEQRLLLTAELKHRVKNSMATIQSIATQTMRNATSLKQATEVLTARMQSLASAHDLLTREQWQSATIAESVAIALESFDAPGSKRFQVGGPRVSLGPRAAMAMVLALHELCTNAVKYGALSTPSGHVTIDWLASRHGADQMIEFRWQEVGGPAVTGRPSRSGFGTRLIEKVLAAELNGRGRIQYLPSGLVFTILAPLPDQDKISGTPDDEEIFRRNIGSFVD